MKYRLQRTGYIWEVINNYNNSNVGHVKYEHDKLFFKSTNLEWLTPHDMHKIQLLMFELKERYKEHGDTVDITRYRGDIMNIVRKEICAMKKSNKEKVNDGSKKGFGGDGIQKTPRRSDS